MKITSKAFQHNQTIPGKYTCDGEDINPPLQIAEVPTKAKSLVLIVDDPDAPSGTFVHWLVFNIPPAITKIEEDSVPANSIEGKTSFGGVSYGGPCPPSGTHNYHFKIYALDEKLKLDAAADKKAVEDAMTEHILDWTEIIGLYERK